MRSERNSGRTLRLFRDCVRRVRLAAPRRAAPRRAPPCPKGINYAEDGRPTLHSSPESSFLAKQTQR